MHFNYFLGFDVSRNTLDYALIGPDGGLIERGKVDNKVANIRQLLSSLVSQLNGPSSSLLICAEEGGLYTNFLKLVAAQEEYSLWMADALELKLRSGRRKEKSDPADAWMIPNFALRYADQAKIYQLPEAAIRQIKLASRQRQALDPRHCRLEKQARRTPDLWFRPRLFPLL
ncbi:transposase [Neolewinella lacunae]|uniref:Transposase n=1 Tax=Neolewinella lacunae TaxID=1517758 RepID=A0A923TDP1_9BACT|nr:transposase [Neolewinella lacunae]MBC6995052.1 transposase [Neolewinella lacunae]MDN3635401.1 transposase [Neolewinella lacunae]